VILVCAGLARHAEIKFWVPSSAQAQFKLTVIFRHRAPLSMKTQTPFPFIQPAHALLVLRVALAIFFMAHAAVRIVRPDSIPSFANYLGQKGWPFSLLIVWLITVLELSAGSLMILGKWVRWCAAGLFFIAAMGIVIIHFKLGWFVGEHGTGGMEYSLCLMVSLLVVAAFDAHPRPTS
jgi:putative oxidoreductase